MKNALVYLMIYFLFPCINRTAERRKVDEETNLCLLLSRSINPESIDNMFIGFQLCFERAREKYKKLIRKKIFFRFLIVDAIQNRK